MNQDSLNRSTWTRPSSRRWLDALTSYTDPGERAALDRVRARAAGKPVLDLGVGTGRTIPMLSRLGSDYLGVDYLPEMVEACRAKHPDARIELGDARALDGVPSVQFGLVCFSFNGIDAVDHEGRLRVLAEMRRVVRGDGVVVFSTLNLDGPAFRERPWSLRVAPTRHPLRLAARVAGAVSTMPLDLARWSRLRAHAVEGPGWAVAPLSAHHYGVLAHFTTLQRQLDELEDAGLGGDVTFFESERGERIEPGADTSRIGWFHVVAHPR